MYRKYCMVKRFFRHICSITFVFVLPCYVPSVLLLKWPTLCYLASVPASPSYLYLSVSLFLFLCLWVSCWLSLSCTQHGSKGLICHINRSFLSTDFLFLYDTPVFPVMFVFFFFLVCLWLDFLSTCTCLVLFIAEPPALSPTPVSPSKCHSSVEGGEQNKVDMIVLSMLVCVLFVCETTCLWLCVYMSLSASVFVCACVWAGRWIYTHIHIFT